MKALLQLIIRIIDQRVALSTQLARILVTYGTKYGSTAEIAARVGQRFTDAGFDTDVLHANFGIDIAKYDGLVVGSPMYAGTWLPDPSLLLVVNQELVTRLPVALFSVGMIDLKHPGKLREEHDAWVEKAFFDEGIQMNVIASDVFNGSYSPRNLPWWMRIVEGILRVTPRGDHRDWQQIERWSDETAQAMKSVLNSPVVDELEPQTC